MRLKDYIIIAGVAIVLAIVLKSFVVGVVHIPSPSMESTLLPGDYVLVNKLIHGSNPDEPASLAASWFKLPTVRSLRPGDVVLFRLPVDPPGDPGHPLFVKRCVAVPGDTLSVDRGILLVNGRVLTTVADVSTYVAQANLAVPMIVPARGETIDLNRSTLPRWIALLNAEGHEATFRDGAVWLDGVQTSRYTVRQNYYFMLGDNAGHSFDSRAWGLLPESLIEGAVEMVYWSVDESTRTGMNSATSIRWNRIGYFIQ